MGSCFATTESIFLLTIPSVLTYPHSLIAPINSTKFFAVFNCLLIGGVSGLSADDAIGMSYGNVKALAIGAIKDYPT